jgi:hypothetical protein
MLQKVNRRTRDESFFTDVYVYVYIYIIVRVWDAWNKRNVEISINMFLQTFRSNHLTHVHFGKYISLVYNI